MTVSTPAAASRIFISYRREETAYPAGWLFDRLVEHFGHGQVFKDVDSIQPGDDFVEVITTAVGKCDVLLALIGSQWLTITGGSGRCLDDPDDFVRLEIEAALTRNVRVIPILVGGAQMPHAAQLPPSLAKLVRRHALELSPSRFDFDIGQLLSVLDRSLAERQAQRADLDASHRAARVKLASESAVIAAPMSFAGSTARVRNVVERIHGNMSLKISAVTGLVLVLLLWWATIACWYLIFGILLVPYRLFRRGQRKRDVAMLRHREMMAAMTTRPRDRNGR